MNKRRRDRPSRVLGYALDRELMPVREHIDTAAPGDYGCDPLPGGMFRMVPSGDVVDAGEKERRLRARRRSTIYARPRWSSFSSNDDGAAVAAVSFRFCRKCCAVTPHKLVTPSTYQCRVCQRLS